MLDGTFCDPLRRAIATCSRVGCTPRSLPDALSLSVMVLNDFASPAISSWDFTCTGPQIATATFASRQQGDSMVP